MSVIEAYNLREEKMCAIEKIWIERGANCESVEEPEWDEYENNLYLMAEMFTRCQEVKEYVLAKCPEKFSSYGEALQAG